MYLFPAAKFNATFILFTTITMYRIQNALHNTHTHLCGRLLVAEMHVIHFGKNVSKSNELHRLAVCCCCF